MLTLSLAGIVKNEADSILEWIAYHRVIGVNHFFIADNESTDGTREILAALRDAGLVTLMDIATQPDRKPQLPAYNTILDLAKGKCDLLAYIDADEFLLPTDGSETIHPFLETIFADLNVSAVALNWANFGSSGHIFIEEGLVIDRFTRRAKQDGTTIHHHYKTIVRPERGINFHNPHHVNIASGIYVNSLGEPLVAHEKHGLGLSAKVSWERVRLNHYATKSLEEFLLGKSRRGSASKEGRIKHKRYFQHHDRNDEECLIAKKYVALTQEEIRRLCSLLPDVIRQTFQSQ